jgi:hypothetical protein
LSDNLNTFLEQHQYFASIQANSKKNLIERETIRYDYDKQKTTKEEKQTQLEGLQKTLASQKINLANQKSAKNQLLKFTEAEYGAILSKLSSLNNSSVGCLDSSPGGGIDGNFYSQRDPRWCKQYIGLQTTYTIGGAGCYLTSMCIVLKKIGYDVTPSVYAADPNKFTSSADLKEPTPPPGYTYKKLSYSSNTIDNELNASRYVIAQVPMRGSPSGYHFIVLISGSNGNYKMHDPVYGSDKNFSEYYSTGSIISIRLITK